MEESIVVPRKQAWLSWVGAIAPWMLAGCLVFAKYGGYHRGSPLTMSGILVALVFVVVSSAAWVLLRKVPVFRVSERMHSVQVVLYVLGWGVALAQAMEYWS